MVENRRVGIKSREVYECPGSLALLMAHADLEDLTLERDLAHEKARLEPRYAELVYDGLWFAPLKQALDAFVEESQRFVTGEVRLRCEQPGRCIVAGRRSPAALYDYDLATYEAADRFRHDHAEGFVRLWGLGVETWAARQARRGDAGATAAAVPVPPVNGPASGDPASGGPASGGPASGGPASGGPASGGPAAAGA
jgi:argininosuccinate synthase